MTLVGTGAAFDAGIQITPASERYLPSRSPILSMAPACQLSTSSPGNPAASWNSAWRQMACCAPSYRPSAGCDAEFRIFTFSSGVSKSATFSYAQLISFFRARLAHADRCRFSRGLSTWLRVGLKKIPGACSSLLNGKIIISVATRADGPAAPDLRDAAASSNASGPGKMP